MKTRARVVFGDGDGFRGLAVEHLSDPAPQFVGRAMPCAAAAA